jgi:hypothetical protein
MDEVGSLRRLVVLAVLIVGSVVLLGASQPLNPLVVRSSQATMPVPPECEEGLSTVPAQRVETTAPEPEVTPATIPAPPSRDLDAALSDAQSALDSSDRASFDASVSRLKTLLSTYPEGEERRLAEEAVRIYDDAAKIWTSQFESPFFGESSDAYRIANQYPGHAEAVRRQVFVDRDGNRFYPADETRDFLSRLSAERLARLGVKVEPVQIARAPRPAAQDDDNIPPLPPVVARTTPEPVVSTPAAPPSARPTPAPVRQPVARSTTKPSGAAPSRPEPAKPAAAKPAPVRATTPPPPDDLPASSPVVATTPAASTPAAVTTPVPAPATTEPPPPAVVETASTTTEPDGASASAPDTGSTATVAPSRRATIPAAPAVPPTQPARTRSVLLSVILILIGVGVLVLLFRTAD